MTLAYDVVIPTTGRSTLGSLLATLLHAPGPRPPRVVVADDRIGELPALRVPGAVVVVRTRGRGPAAARNAGAAHGTSPWIVFLDDDVELPADWAARLATDLRAATGADARVSGVSGRIVVPRPARRRPTDWERNVAGLEHAWWATADMAIRRDAFVAVGGFDERFPRAYREDADLALRLEDAGYELRRGRRVVRHPVRAAPWYVSVLKQAGNADDARMRRRHGRAWRGRAHAGSGALRRHAATTVIGATALGAAALRRRRAASLAAVGWGAATSAFALRRIAPGPRDAREIAAMVATSIVIPPCAVAWRVRGELAVRRSGC